MTAARTRPAGNGRPSRPPQRRREPPREEADAAATAEPADLGAGQAFPRVLQAVGAFVAPTTAVTALLIYFGQLHAYAFYWHFGVNYTVLDFTTTDYLVRSADGLFVPIAVAAAVVLVGLWLNRFVLHRLRDTTSQRIVHVVAPVAGAVGLLLAGLAFVLVMAAGLRRELPPETGGVALVVGVLLLVYSVRLARKEWNARRPPGARRVAGTGLAEWAAAFVLITVGLFWAVNSYATGVGTGRALQLRNELPSWPETVVFSERSLSLAVDGVTEVECSGEEAAYRFRYDGLKLVQEAGGHYLLLPSTWTRSSGTAVLLPRDSSVRLEFGLAGATRPTGC